MPTSAHAETGRSLPQLLALPLLALLLMLTGLLGPAGTAAAATSPAYVETSVDNPVSAEPPVSRPPTPHCTRTLARQFPSNAADGSPQNYTGTLRPPTACPGPWAKVVLDQTISVAGRQFDRSASVSIGGVQVYFGTTEEPDADGITYHVAHDITQYSSVLGGAQPFTGGIGNYTDSTYTGIYVQTVRVTYYRADAAHPAAATPDRVIGTPLTDVNASDDTAHFTLADLPRNITHAYLEITVKGNGCDEQWFTAVPDAVSAAYPDAGLCGGGPYREVQESIDGTPAGTTQFFPYIYSGGIVPTLWRPLPAIGTNDLTPETLDVTPFVGRLVDGGSHDLAVRIFGARDSWNVEANLLMFTDHGATRTSGALVSAAVATDPGVSTTVSSIAHGSRAVVSTDRSDRTVGWVQTSAGRVTTTVTGTSAYRSSNDITAAGLTEDVTATDHGAQRSVSRIGSQVIRSGARYFSYPLSVLQQVTSYTDDQNFALAGTVSMTRSMVLTKAGGDGSRPMGTPTIFSSENVHSHGTLARTGGATSTADGNATAYFLGTDEAGHFYRHYLAAQHGMITDDSLD